MSDATLTPRLSSAVPPYPPAPWHLHGWAFQTLSLVDLTKAHFRVPEGLHVVRVTPRHTLGCLYVATYGRGSALEYHELIAFPALVWRAGQLGFLVSHIYVDHPASRAGGQAIWNLPKELADFEVDEGARGRRVVARQEGRTIVAVEHRPGRLAAPLPVPLPAFGALSDPPSYFVGRALSRLGVAAPRVEIPSDSPLASLGLGDPFLGLSYAGLDLLAAAPKALPGRAAR
jgi:acetoacetate decarboxylase